jgi:hypothetical protein
MAHRHRWPTVSPPLHCLPRPIKSSHTSATPHHIRFCPQAYSFLHQSATRRAPSAAAPSHRCRAESRRSDAYKRRGEDSLSPLLRALATSSRARSQPLGAAPASPLLAPATGPSWTSELHRVPSPRDHTPGPQDFPVEKEFEI